MRQLLIASTVLCSAILFADWAIEEAKAQNNRKRAAEAAQTSKSFDVDDCRVRLIDDVQLASARTGIVESVVVEGEVVESGQIVARLKDEILQAGLAITERQAENDIEVRFARKASELAQLKYARAAEASRAIAGTVSELELKELRLSAEKSLLQVEQTEQQYLVAGLRRDESAELLKTCRVTAPFHAEVLEVFKRPGEVVREGEPILRLASGARMRVEGFLSIELAAKLKRGIPVQVTVTDDVSNDVMNETFTGKLMFIDMKVEPVSRKVKIWAEIPNDRGLLRDGLTARLRFPARNADVARRGE